MSDFRTPVAHHLSALGIVDEMPIVEDVCIGCGLRAIPCPAEAVRLERRTDVAAANDLCRVASTNPGTARLSWRLGLESRPDHVSHLDGSALEPFL